ncbi:hypothetical protein PHO31112_04770 [Pandoraea horticolens]|uniref:Uncharacterized protein n=1 Tax=Pandoraea horticolens TaxID=2508298 RepID=A0A5E4YTU2_9BURK|nr:hypothetical protein [Pandoraea horticolens]VVE52231.1 hypothetical protein PHO31112_04770 [Pandoraea horticolens]
MLAANVREVRQADGRSRPSSSLSQLSLPFKPPTTIGQVQGGLGQRLISQDPYANARVSGDVPPGSTHQLSATAKHTVEIRQYQTGWSDAMRGLPCLSTELVYRIGYRDAS